MTIKSVIKKEETIEKEISLPYFYESDEGSNNWKLVIKFESEEKAIMVLYFPAYITTIQINSPSTVLSMHRPLRDITEQEFNEAYHKALFEIGKYVPAPDVPKELINSNGEFENYVKEYYINSPTYPGCFLSKNCDYPLLTMEQIRKNYEELNKTQQY